MTKRKSASKTKAKPVQEKDTTYQGWTNYETWAVALWMDNDQGSQGYFHDMTRTCLEFAKDLNVSEVASRVVLADRIKTHHEEMAEQFMGSQSGVFADLLNASLDSVNWYEIAQHLIDEVNEEK